MPTIRVTHEFLGWSDYWKGNGCRWEDDKGCLFAFIGPDTTLHDCVDQWVSDFFNGGDFDYGWLTAGTNDDTVGSTLFADVNEKDIRDAILATLLSDQGRADYESGALCTAAGDLRYCGDDRHDRHDCQMWVVLAEIVD